MIDNLKKTQYSSEAVPSSLKSNISTTESMQTCGYTCVGVLLVGGAKVEPSFRKIVNTEREKEMDPRRKTRQETFRAQLLAVFHQLRF